MPSLRWIHENLVPPNVEEESSDIDDSCSDDSYDFDIASAETTNILGCESNKVCNDDERICQTNAKDTCNGNG